MQTLALGIANAWFDVLPDVIYETEERPHVDTAVAPSAAFTALDRCDRCGAQAYVRVELTSGGELLFCAHHAREHAEKLQEVAASIHDDTRRLSGDSDNTP
jgi:hypothetical protein